MEGMEDRRTGRDEDARQRLLDATAEADVWEGIRQGLEDARAGWLQRAEEFFAEFEARHGIGR
jgi:hypothetical protein